LGLKAAKTEAPAPSTSTNTNNIQSSGTGQEKDGFDKDLFSLQEPTSPWVVVNKKRGLPADFAPEDLVVPDIKLRLGAGDEQMKIRKPVSSAFVDMFSAAKTEGVALVFGSGYRSETLQKQFYSQYVAKSGQAAADTFSARPGFSEHQTGLAADITSSSGSCHLEICFKETPEGKWIAAHAHEYGFIIRYPEGKEAITGYQYEPWHLRYVSTPLATELKDSGQTMEEFFGLPAASQY